MCRRSRWQVRRVKVLVGGGTVPTADMQRPSR
jgi:hypothetical protein